MSQSPAPKTNLGNFFEDFRLGQEIRHATPRTVTLGDVALYNGLFGSRFAVQSSDVFAAKIGYPRSPVDDLLVFHVVFGKTVPDISLNAVANLGYADCRFLKPVYPGDTLNSVSQVIGLKENSNKKTGIVYVRSRGFNQSGDAVLDYARWVMVRKRDEAAPAPGDKVPELPKSVEPAQLGAACPPLDAAAYDNVLAGSPHRFGDYKAGEKIDHSRRHHRRGRRAHDRHAALSEHRAHPFRSLHRKQRPLRQKADLWRPRHFAGARAELQRARQCVPRGGDQWRTPRGTVVRRANRVRLVRGAGHRRIARPRRTSARCVCAPSPPRTGRAAISRSRAARNTTRR